MICYRFLCCGPSYMHCCCVFTIASARLSCLYRSGNRVLVGTSPSVERSHGNKSTVLHWEHFGTGLDSLLMMLISLCRHRYAAKNPAVAHNLLDPECVCNILHPGRTRALLDRRFHSVLHHIASLPLLSLARKQPRPAAARQRPNTHLVPSVLVLWVVHRRYCAQWVRVAGAFDAHSALLVQGARAEGSCFVNCRILLCALRVINWHLGCETCRKASCCLLGIKHEWWVLNMSCLPSLCNEQLMMDVILYSWVMCVSAKCRCCSCVGEECCGSHCLILCFWHLRTPCSFHPVYFGSLWVIHWFSPDSPKPNSPKC